MIQHFYCSSGCITPTKYCHFFPIGENAMAHKSMENSSLSCYFIISPKAMPSILKHFFPSIACQLTSYHLICNITILNRMNPTKNSLTTQFFQIISIAYFGITDNLLAQRTFS